jgi:hypothetical protein
MGCLLTRALENQLGHVPRTLLDHLVGAREQRRRNVEAERSSAVCSSALVENFG